MASVYLFEGERLRAIPSPDAARRLRWAAWRPGGAFALLAGNRGQVLRFDGERFDALPSQSAHNLRGAAYSPAGALAGCTDGFDSAVAFGASGHGYSSHDTGRGSRESCVRLADGSKARPGARP